MAAVSAGYELLFLRTGLNRFDEGWPLYAAQALQNGRTLYRDVFFVFPPGHMLPAALAYALDPPGVVAARILYAAFNVALCTALYFLGRRLMPSHFALLGALLLACAAPRSHLYQHLFGYRFALFSVVALLFFARGLRSDAARWSVAAGASAGVMLLFRLTPAFAVTLGIGVGFLIAKGRHAPRHVLFYSAGLLGVVVPVVVYFAASVGLEVLWREAVLRPVAMTAAQSMPIQGLGWPKALDRRALSEWFVGAQFVLYALLYCAYLGALGARGWSRIRRGQPLDSALLCAVVIWGAVYFSRAVGRCDEGHLESTLPPTLLLIANALAIAFRRIDAPGWRRAVALALCCGVPLLWHGLWGSDDFFRRYARWRFTLEQVDGPIVDARGYWAESIDDEISVILKMSGPGDTILDLSRSPLLHPVTGRMGPGTFDVVTPGTFSGAEEEEDFIRILNAAPPAVVVLAKQPFDDMPSRGVSVIAPRVTRWVHDHYAPVHENALFWTLKLNPDATRR